MSALGPGPVVVGVDGSSDGLESPLGHRNPTIHPIDAHVRAAHSVASIRG